MTKAKKKISLRAFVLILIGLALVVFSAIFFFIFYTAMPKMLVQAEDKYLARQLDVVDGMLKASQRNTFLMTDDTGIWDETVSFALGENMDYIKSNWPDGSLLQSYKFNFIVIKNKAGQDLYVEFHDYVHDQAMPVPPGFTAMLTPIAEQVFDTAKTPAEASAAVEDLGQGGIIFFSGVPYFFAAMPIKLSRESDAPAGTIIMGNILDNEFFRNLTHYETITFEMIRPEIDTGFESAVVRRESDNVVATTMPLKDYYGHPALLRMSDTRTIYSSGQTILNRTTVLIIAAMILLAALLYFIVARWILKPVETLSRDIGRLADTKALDTGKYSRSREFVTLCTAINDMLQRLDQSRISIDAMQRILNGMDADILVSEPDTDKIIFMNTHMLHHYNITGEAVGRTCEEVMRHDKTVSCAPDPMPSPPRTPGVIRVWEEKSLANGRYYRHTASFIEWLDKKLVHLRYSVDISDTKAAEQALTKRLEQQELMSAMSQSFISTSDMSSLINNALRMTGEFMGVSKVLLARMDATQRNISLEYSWLNKIQELPATVDRLIAMEKMDLMAQRFTVKGESYVAVNDVGASDGYELAKELGVKSFMAAPVYAAGSFWGILYVTHYMHKYNWSESDIQLLKLITTVISGVLSRDITERDLIRMSSIVNSSPQFISYINPAGGFEYLNQGALDKMGYTAEELMAGGARSIFDQETYTLLINKILPDILKYGKNEYELTAITKNGQRIVLSFSGFTTNFGADSGHVGIGAIARDVTEQRRLEQELIKARDQAEQSSHAKSDFLSRMSHEMRTPLNAIIGMTSIAKSSEDPERKEYCLDKIGDASKHLLGVINDILDMSKIEANKFELSYTEFNFEKMLMRVINVVNFRIDEKSQNLIINLGKSVPNYIVCDEQRLAQVIANLLSNAVKFTPDMGTITLSTEKMDEDANGLCTLKVTITDTGIGISKEQQQRLFKSFEQADGGIARKFGGTGLGLAISKSIVELMDGEIWVESEPDQGASFVFTIKARRGERPTQSLLSPDINWKTLRILAVDDASEVREYFLNFTRSIGVHCEVAADGYEACEIIDKNRDHPFNIVFADWKMPVMNGIELTKKIKDEFGTKIVVIMISATEWAEIKEEAKEAGVDRFIPKPLFPSLIVDCINECMSFAQQEAPSVDNKNLDANCFAGFRILLAEDIEINREIVAALLQHTGVQIDTAENGAKAYEMFKENPSLYDMILMDIHMPEVDGYEATRLIRSLDLSQAATIPIVAMTANVFKEDIERCLAAGMNDHIGKPVDTDELIQKMKKNLHIGYGF